MILNTIRNNKFNNHIVIGVSTFILILMTLTGCGESETIETVLIDNASDYTAYSLTAVTTGDVVLTKKLGVTYTQEKEQEISFNTGGRRIAKVYVNAGDIVRRGDLLVELDSAGLAEQIDALEYSISVNEKQLEYLDAAEQFEEQSSYNNLVYNHSEIDEDDLKAYQDSHDEILQNYRYKREDYSDALEFDRRKLTSLKNELSSSKITSNMDGVVYKVTENLEGSTSHKDEVVMTVVDNSSGKFVMNEPEYAAYFKEGDIIPLKIVYTSALGDYEVTPTQMSAWGDEQYFEIISGPENDGIDVGTTASISIELERRSGVLALPVGAVHYADSKPYVYILDENDFRQVAWIKTGLTGDDKIEIVSGLSDGDKVVY